MTTLLTRRDINRALLAGAAALAAPAPVAARALAPALRASPLFDFAIAGGWYYELGRCRASLGVGERLVLRAEPENRYDADAIVVERADGAKLGYVPRSANPPIAALLRAGVRVEADIVGWLDRGDSEDAPDDLAYTGFAPGEPRIRLTRVDG